MVRPNPFVLAALICAVFSGNVRSAPTRYAVDRWTTEEGLPQNSVMTITQTRDGYLWLGTLNGVVRFDGARFAVFDESNTPGLRSSRILRLFEDSQTNLWIGTESGGILIAEPGGRITTASISPGKEGPATRLMSITEDQTGTVWLYTADGQLGRYFNKRMDVWNASFGVISQVRTLAADGSGFLWVGAFDRAVAVGPLPAHGQALPIAQRVAVPGLDFLLTSRRGGYWRLANGVIQYCAGETVTNLGRYPWKQGVIVSAACEDLAGNLIVGTYGDPAGDGVYWFGGDGQAIHLEGLSHNSILSLAVDRSGSLWIGTDGGGLHHIREQAFWVPPTTQEKVVQSVSSDSAGGVWIGYNGDRIDYIRGEEARQFAVVRPGAALAVRSVYVDSQNTVWAGTFGGGLFRYAGGSFNPVFDFDLVGNPRISALFRSGSGRLWVGTQGGLAYAETGEWRTIGVLDGLPAGPVQAIAEDEAGDLWVGTGGGGLCRISKGEMTVYTRTNGLPSDNVTALHAGDSGTVWVGTSAGLAWQADGNWNTMTSREGLSGNSIRYLLEDSHGFLWIGSNGGLMRAGLDELAKFAKEKTNAALVRAYGRADGVPTRECSEGSQPAAARTPDGKLWFATIKGVAVVDPERMNRNTNPPPVVVEAVLVDGRVQGEVGLRSRPPRVLVVPSGREAIDVQFAVLNLSAADKARFRHRLEGHETSWTEGTGSYGLAHHARVPPGEYRFRVEAANEDDVWNTIGAELAVTVLPPFWRTWWFLTLTVMAALGLVVGTVHFVSTQKLQRQLVVLRQQEALERERGRIARDLHDQLGANLTQVALLGELAEADKDLPSEVEAHARQISATARETTRALDEIVWTVNPANDTLDGLVNYICKYAQDYFGMADLRYRIEIPPDLPSAPISPEVRHHVFLAAKEAVNNVVKHARATSAWLRLALEPGHFMLEIEDDGCGLSSDARQKGRNGLRNMESRMRDLGGTFELAARPGGGTIARLTAPLKAVTPQQTT